MVDASFYSLSAPVSVQAICDQFGLTCEGDASLSVSNVASFPEADSECITFFNAKEFRGKSAHTQASVCIVKKEDKDLVEGSVGAFIFSDHPYMHFSKVAHHLFPTWNMPIAPQETGVHPTAKVDPTARIAHSAFVGAGAVIGAGAQLGPNVVVGPGTHIGEGCALHSNVVVEYTHMGKGCVVLNGTTIGQAGFGFSMEDGLPVDMPQLGRVIVEDGVSVGANATIDRGALSDTVIGAGTRIDNLVQIAHGVKIGRGCIIVSQVGISGSCVIGDYSALGGQVGLSDHVTLGKHVQVAAQSGVMRSCGDHEVLGGTPAVSVSAWRRQCAYLNRVTRKG